MHSRTTPTPNPPPAVPAPPEGAPAASFLLSIWTALGGDATWLSRVTVAGEGDLPSCFAVTDLAAAAIGVAGLAVAEQIGAGGSRAPVVTVDRRLASLWFGQSIVPEGWELPPVWDAVAGDYAAADGWIRLHTNAPHHRDAALAVLGTPADREAVAAAVRSWRADDLEAAVVARGGCAAAMRSCADWAAHPQGHTVTAEPLVRIEPTDSAAAPARACDPARPLAGVRVLDLTRILAGPVATRFLAGFGAEVLRIDPPDWDEPALAPDVTVGKRCARLDLRAAAGRDRFLALLAEADVLVHGYRSDALERLGLGTAVRRAARPGLVDVALDAYGWTGPWAARRGFDSLVQMSAGLAEAGMRRFGRDRPTPLPVQALDQATGYVMAAAAVRGLTVRAATGRGSMARLSLARTAALLAGVPAPAATVPLRPRSPADLADAVEPTAWGPARRLRPPVTVMGADMAWDSPATRLGSSSPAW